MPIDPKGIKWDDAPAPQGIVWDDAPAPTVEPAKPQTMEQLLGPSDFTKAFASTPARMLKSSMQMLGAGNYVPDAVSNAAAEADKSMLGRIAGDIAGTGGIRAGVGPMAQALQAFKTHRGFLPAAARVADAASLGAAQGAITTPDQQGEAALYGAAGGAVGHTLGRVINGLVRPTADARVLLDRGVALTPGQAAGVGSMVNRLEQSAASLPVAGHFISNAQRRAVDEANVAAAQSVANIVDNNVKLGVPVREAIEQTRDMVGKTYDSALQGLTVPGFVPQAYLAATKKAVEQSYPMLEKSQLDQMGRYVSQRIDPMIKQNGGILTGKMLKQVDSEMGQHVRNLRASANAADKTAVPAWQDMQQSIREVIENHSSATPEQTAQLRNANSAYRQLLALERSLLPGADRFTPRQLRRSLDKSGIQGTELNQVGDAMERTLPNTVANSGTAERLLTAGLPAMLMGGGAGAQSMGWDTLGTGMMAAGALGSRPGARFLTGSGALNQQALATALRRGVPAASRPQRDDQ